MARQPHCKAGTATVKLWSCRKPRETFQGTAPCFLSSTTGKRLHLKHHKFQPVDKAATLKFSPNFHFPHSWRGRERREPHHQHFPWDTLNLTCSWESSHPDPLWDLCTLCTSCWETRSAVLAPQVLYKMWKYIQNCLDLHRAWVVTYLGHVSAETVNISISKRDIYVCMVSAWLILRWLGYMTCDKHLGNQPNFYRKPPCGVYFVRNGNLNVCSNLSTSFRAALPQTATTCGQS